MVRSGALAVLGWNTNMESNNCSIFKRRACQAVTAVLSNLGNGLELFHVLIGVFDVVLMLRNNTRFIVESYGES